MRNIKLVVGYDGTDFHGWQRQDGPRTAQGELEDALRRLTGEDVSLVAASRTDAGVHALGQTVNFRTGAAVPSDRFHHALGSFLPHDLSAMDSCEVPDDFNARLDSIAKEYWYVLQRGPQRIPWLRRNTLHVPDELDLPSVRDAAAALIGERDFSALGNAGSSPSAPVKTIYSIDIVEDGRLLIIKVYGSSFLYKMVRNIAGLLIEAGRGKVSPGRVEEIIASRDRAQAGPTLPPQGLYLMRVDYGQKTGP